MTDPTPRAALLADITEAVAWSRSWSRDEFAMQNARTLHYDMAGRFEPLLERAAAEIRALETENKGLRKHLDQRASGTDPLTTLLRKELDAAQIELAALRQERDAMEQLADETWERVVAGIHKELDALGIPDADPERGIAGKGHLLRIQDGLAALAARQAGRTEGENSEGGSNG